MIARATRRLPGVQFESRAAALDEVFPRMDVAAFVGFASAGPLDTPVPIDDVSTFADVFGDDPALAVDLERSELVRGNLGPAVRVFFRNGATRCWIVRVAGASAASNRFGVPGLARLGADGVRPASAVARAEGSWSDAIEIAAVTSLQPLTVDAIDVDGASVASVRLRSPDNVAPGDLLRLQWSDGGVVLAPIATVEDGVAAVVEGRAVWLLPAPGPGPWGVSYFPRSDGEAESLPDLAQDPIWKDDGTATLTFAAATPLVAGQFVRLARGQDQVWVVVSDIRATAVDASPPVSGSEVSGRWSRPATSPASAPPAGELPACDRVRMELWVRDGGDQPRRLGDIGMAPGHPRYFGALPTDQQLFGAGEDVLSDAERALRDRVRALVGDATDLRTYHAGLWQAVANPRFALAVDRHETDVFIPLGMPILPDAYLGPDPIEGDPATRDGLVRFDAAVFVDPDLAGETTRSLKAQAEFLRWQQPTPRPLKGMHAVLDLDEVTLLAAPDAVNRAWLPELVAPPAPLDAPVLSAFIDGDRIWHLSWNSVAPEARYVLEEAATADFVVPVAQLLDAGVTSHVVPASSASRQWFRVRAYVPPAADAVTRLFGAAGNEAAGSFWSDPIVVTNPPQAFDDCPPGALGAPELTLVAPADATGTYRLSWTAVGGSLRSVVEESTALDFLHATTVFRGAANDVTLYGRAAGRYHYRVRAEGSEATVGPALVESAAGAAGATFHVTGLETPRHLVTGHYLGGIGDETIFDGDAFTERFLAASRRNAIAGGFRYDLRRDQDWPGVPGFRAFALDVAGGWSNGVSVDVAAPARHVLEPASAYPQGTDQKMLAIHAALVRLAAARGDVVAVLGLPEHFREHDVIEHVTALRASVPEDDAWSFGALYHPWLVVEDNEATRRAPPDGAACAMMATRALTRGAWVAPANTPLLGVLGLSPSITREQWQRLYDAQVNLVRDEAHGFVVLGADTLSGDPDLTPINVRRLLALLRRIALRVGPTFVFEPNSPLFRRTVAREFEALLATMFRAGAFAGGTSSSAYQVVVDASVNTDASVDAGRLIVELKVAPSVPLSFLTVRLVQDGGGIQVTEGG